MRPIDDGAEVSMVLMAAERTLKRVLRVASIALLAVAALMAAAFAIGPLRPALDATPVAAVLLASTPLAAMLCIYAGGDPRRRRALASVSAAVLAFVPARPDLRHGGH